MGEGLNAERPDKLSVVVFSGDFDKVHYALVMASAAAAIDTPTTLFFTMDGARALLKDNAWADLPTTGGIDRGADMDAHFKDVNVADFETLLSACKDLGVRILVCEMGLKALGIKREDLRTDLKIDLGGVVTFLNDASKTGAMIFV